MQEMSNHIHNELISTRTKSWKIMKTQPSLPDCCYAGGIQIEQLITSPLRTNILKISFEKAKATNENNIENLYANLNRNFVML